MGCHLIPVHGKDKLIQPTAMALELGMPHFVIFDADGNTERHDHRTRHQRDNRALISLLGIQETEFPAQPVLGGNCAIWPANMGAAVKTDFPLDQYNAYVEAARQAYNHEGGLEKHDLFIAEWLTSAFGDGLRSGTLEVLCDIILDYARTI